MVGITNRNFSNGSGLLPVNRSSAAAVKRLDINWSTLCFDLAQGSVRVRVNTKEHNTQEVPIYSFLVSSITYGAPHVLAELLV